MKISIKGLTKKFTNSKLESDAILKKINLDIESGEILSIIGTNGAGKTTLLNIISGRLGYDEGCVEYNSISKDSITIVNSNDRSFFWNLTVKQNLNFFTPGFHEDRNNNELIETLDLKKRINNKYSSLSSGEKKKMMICRSIISGAKVLILDEFTNSIDHVAKNATYKLVKELIKNNVVKIVIFVTHDINEVLSLATRCAVLNNGVISKDIVMNDKIDYSYIKKLMEC